MHPILLSYPIDRNVFSLFIYSIVIIFIIFFFIIIFIAVIIIITIIAPTDSGSILHELTPPFYPYTTKFSPVLPLLSNVNG